MKPTRANFFVDSNIFLYLLSDSDAKKGVAIDILKSCPVISTQVVSENANVLFKKFSHLGNEIIGTHLSMLLNFCVVKSLTPSVVNKAFEIKIKYGFSWYDSTIVATAIIEKCELLFSEDFQHNQYIENQLRIVNPFLDTSGSLL